jgi:hypothetical protein
MNLKRSELKHHSITKYSMILEKESKVAVYTKPSLTPQKLTQIPHTTRDLGQ